MSLTGHLGNPTSPVNIFLSTRFPNTRALTTPENTALRIAGCSCPPPDVAGGYPYADVGRAIDYRIRYFYEATSSDELVAWLGGQFLIAQSWSVDEPADPEAPYEIEGEVVLEFFKQLDAFIAATRPFGRLLVPRDEARLARFCFVLSLFESKYRSGETATSLYLPDSRQTVAGLLAIPPQHVVKDLVDLATLFYDRCQDLLPRPAILNPVFAGSLDVGGADADIVVDGVLYEIKTSKNNRLEAIWLRQLIGYLLLDYDDELQIRGLGFYLVRQGKRLVWPVEELLSKLSGQETPPHLAALRAEFRQVCAPEEITPLPVMNRYAPPLRSSKAKSHGLDRRR